MTRSWGRIVFGALLLVVGIGWLLQTAGLIDFPLRALTPLALIVVGIGVVIGARHGRQGGLIVLGAVLTAILMIGSSSSTWAVDVDRGVGFNDRVHRPSTQDDLRPYRAGAGQLTIDLTDLRLGLDGGTHEVEGRVGAGRILVIVPRGVAVRVRASSGVGSVEVFGDRRSSGIGVDDTFQTRDWDSSRPRISLSLRAGVGSIKVIRGGTVRVRPEIPEMPNLPEIERPGFPFDDVRSG